MSQSFCASFVIPETQERVEVRGEFSSDEWERLLRFAEYAEELEETALFQNGGEIRANFSLDGNGVFNDSSVFPSRPVVAELIHALRPIILQKEPTHFLRVCNLLSKHYSHPYLRKMIDRLRRHFVVNPSEDGWRFEVDEFALNSEEALDAWLNAYEYHRDADKRAELERLHAGPPNDFSKAVFLLLLLRKAEAAITVAGLIRAIEKRGGAEFNVSFRRG